MMLEMFLFKKRSNLLEKAEEIKKMLFEEDEDSEDEDFEAAEFCAEISLAGGGYSAEYY